MLAVGFAKIIVGLTYEERKAYLHKAENNGQTPLSIAAQKGHSQVVGVFIRY